MVLCYYEIVEKIYAAQHLVHQYLCTVYSLAYLLIFVSSQYYLALWIYFADIFKHVQLLFSLLTTGHSLKHLWLCHASTWDIVYCPIKTYHFTWVMTTKVCSVKGVPLFANICFCASKIRSNNFSLLGTNFFDRANFGISCSLQQKTISMQHCLAWKYDSSHFFRPYDWIIASCREL